MNAAPAPPTKAGTAAAPAIVCPDAGGSSSVSSGVGGAAHLFTRTTAGGVTIRAYRLGVETVYGCGPVPAMGAGMPPAFACDREAVTIEMSDAATVGEGTLGAWAVPMETPSASPTTTDPSRSIDPGQLSSGVFGVAEGAPVWWVAGRVPSKVAHAQVVFADGSTDDMAPVDGIVVLAAPVTIDPATDSDLYTVRATVTFIDASGQVVASETLPLPTPAPAPAPSPVPVVTATTAAAGAGGPSTGTGSSRPSTATGTGASPSTGAMIACPLIPVGGGTSTGSAAAG